MHQLLPKITDSMAQVTSVFPFIAIEGNIGAGKTTLSQMLAHDLQRRLILEQFTGNPFLPLFYKQPERYAFSVELFFMTERHKQLQTELAQTQLFESNVIADYFFMKTLLFARHNLSVEEYRLFQRLFHVLNANFPNPDLLLYLHRPIPQLLRQIKGRARSFETDIQAPYLQRVQQSYLEYFRGDIPFPVVLVELHDLDFQQDQRVYRALQQLLTRSYEKGVHSIDLRKVLGGEFTM